MLQNFLEKVPNMSLPPQKFREIVFLLVYTRDFPLSDEEELVLMIMQELKVSRNDVLQAASIVDKILQKKDIIDEMITHVSTSYSFRRIQTVEKNILRLAVYELFIDKKLPSEIVMSEAKRLTRKFSTTEAQNFVFAVLDALFKREQHVSPVYQK